MIELVFEGGKGGTARSTVGITLYNYGRYFSRCADSLIAQDVDDLELIVVDDCSTDDSLNIARTRLADAASRFTRARLFRQRVNGGLAKARNAMFEQADTEFVFVLDADNELFPHCISRHQAALDRTTAAFAYGYHQLFDEAVGLANTMAWTTNLAPGNKVDAMVLIRREVVRQAGGYSMMPVMGWEDFDLWFKLARLGHWGVLVPEVLARYRVHGESMLRTVTNPKVDHLWAHLRSTYPEFFTGSRNSVMFDPIGAESQRLVKRTVRDD